jgi:structural maintenance of chromosomes protein 6
LTKAVEDVTIQKAELHNIGDIEHLLAKKKGLSDQMRANKMKIVDFKVQLIVTSSSISQLIFFQNDQKQMDTENRIAEETRRMEAHSQARQEETVRKLQQARAEVDEIDARLKEIAVTDQAKRAENNEIKAKGDQLDATRVNAEKRIMQINEMMKQCNQQKENALNPYGNNMKELMDQIGAQWHGEKPLGPLGLYVQVKEPELWADLLRSQLSHLLTAFALTDARDRPQLKRMLDKSRK